ncbi:MAG: Rpn family recombination-promoting nuclease/putative transposase [Spirochaetaceae bacterium]|jgi:predicted transposase/invertase (TIGR01784 family)|nr:Rpn family recombination-promoting nuclease/putative transposase [Spirochaetaceae bacterium]
MDNITQAEQTTERLNPLNDFAFQKAMGEKGDEPQLMAFLNAVLERTGKGNIVELEILENKELPAEVVGGKMSKLDVLAKLADGTKVNVEVQIKNEYNMEKRSLYYWSLKFTREFTSGSDYSELTPVVTINIIDFEYFKSIKDFHTSFHLWEDNHKKVKLTDACEIHFLEMPKFRALQEQGKTSFENPLHRWLAYFDKNSPQEVIEEVIKMDAAIQKAQSVMEKIQRDPALRRAYDQYEKAQSDWVSGINGAKREGIKIGEKRGEKRGRNEILDMLRSGKSADEVLRTYA